MLAKMKRLLLLALALLLTVSPVNASLIAPEQLEDQQVSYNTAAVQLGSFVKEYNVPALTHYPLQHALKIENNGAIFAEFTVKEGQTVQKGDVLARFTADASSVTLERLEREIARMEDETALGISQRSKAVTMLENTQAKGLEKEKNAILLKKAKAELEHYQYLQQRSLDALKQEKKAEQEKLNGYTLVAPEDGKVSGFAKLEAGDPVAAGETLMTLIRTDIVQLRVSNSSGDLRYNMPVKVTVGKRNDTTILTGRVVAADGAIPAKERTGYAYIAVETDEELLDPKLTAEVIRLDNVLIAKRTAVVTENGKYYVTKLQDGMLQKRYIGFGMNNTEDVWIIHGVAQGDTLLAD
ncbi:MAG: HlyD family efflux transporter periplasmic adaptor subunit [Oscillospiraceae bacterium]|nr:HlyD family efflux transporter periplasmic adaptor subunit [Oscillospiraceae bacterium]